MGYAASASSRTTRLKCNHVLFDSIYPKTSLQVHLELSTLLLGPFPFQAGYCGRPLFDTSQTGHMRQKWNPSQTGHMESPSVEPCSLACTSSPRPGAPRSAAPRRGTRSAGAAPPALRCRPGPSSPPGPAERRARHAAAPQHHVRRPGYPMLFKQQTRKHAKIKIEGLLAEERKFHKGSTGAKPRRFGPLACAAKVSQKALGRRRSAPTKGKASCPPTRTSGTWPKKRRRKGTGLQK